jgi:ABC-type amino acid transport substrate-binding protein
MFGSSSLRIAVDRGNAPYVVEDGFGLAGASVDVISTALVRRGVEVEFMPVDGLAAQMIALAAGRVDAAADITITERRRDFFSFSNRYLIEELQLFGLKHGPAWTGWRGFTGTVGVKADSYAHEYLVRQHAGVRSLPVGGTARLIELLRDGVVEMALLSRATGAALVAEAEEVELVAHGAPFGAAPLALATLPERAEVLDLFNAGLAESGGGASYAALLGAA